MRGASLVALGPRLRGDERMILLDRSMTYCAVATGSDRAILRLDLLPWARPLQPVDDDPVGRREAGADQAQAVDDRTKLDQLGANGAVVRDREHDLARLVGGDGGVRDEQRVAFAAEQPQPSEETRREQPVLVVEDGAAANGAGPCVEHVVDEVHVALMLEFGLVREPDRDRVLHVAGGRASPRLREPDVAQEVCLAAVEYEVDRVDGHDDGEQRRAARTTGDEVAGIDAPVRDAPGDRCAHLCPFEIELRLLQGSLGRAHLAGGVTLGCPAGIELALGHGLVAHQRGRPLHVKGGDLELGLGALEIGLRLLDRELIGARIDDEQSVALLDQLAFVEVNGIDEAGDACPDLYVLDRDEAAGILVPFGDRLLQRARNGHRRRRRRGRRNRLAVAAACQGMGHEHQCAQEDYAGHGIALQHSVDRFHMRIVA